MGKKISPAVILIVFVPIVIVMLVSTVLIMGCVYGMFFEPQYYSTTDIADYGKYIGNYDNESPQIFITSFFPEEISTAFSDIHYSYKAEKSDSYAFEAYLEFTIQDNDIFEQHIAAAVGRNETKAFCYDPSFTEYTVSECLWFVGNEMRYDYNLDSESQDYHIEEAHIGKILYSVAEQRVIYIAIGVYDGGATTTNYLSTFFNRFQIDPMEYRIRLYTNTGI